MDQIKNSPNKEAIRQKNENDARNIESQIRNKLNSDKLEFGNKSLPGSVCAVLVIGLGIVLTGMLGSLYGFLIGAGLGFLAYFLFNKSADVRRKNLEKAAEREIQKAYNEADQRTMQQINAYDNEVKQYCQRILQKPDTVSSMVQHTTSMFQRMVSHADAGTNKKFIESDFTYKVNNSGITYSYQSSYTNPQDDFNFDRQRFRNLNSNSECEGLAQALAKLTTKEMKRLYPPNSLHITVKHTDAQVTLHFKAANKNFVAARDIF